VVHVTPILAARMSHPHRVVLSLLRNDTARYGEITMDARLNLFGNPIAAKFLKHINSAGKVVSDSVLPAATQELVKIRASQINGCGFCTDMHTKDAAHAGETSLPAST
jgi:AhpD family alkylhydroperoxidase